jgi:hypothetical protein
MRQIRKRGDIEKGWTDLWRGSMQSELLRDGSRATHPL